MTAVIVTLSALCAAFSTVSGFGVWWFLRTRESVYQMQFKPFLLGLAVLLPLAVVVSWSGVAIARDEAVDGYVKYDGTSIRKVGHTDCTGVCNRKVWLEDVDGRNHAPFNPAEFLKAQKEVKADQLPPAVNSYKYVNFFLADQKSSFKAYGGYIEEYRINGLLVPHVQNYQDAIYEGHKIRQVVTSGTFRLANEGWWQDQLAEFNAKFGVTRDGNMSLVFVSDSQVDLYGADRFTETMLAYWQSPELGKFGIAENAVVVFMGINEAQQTVTWARAKTGIPRGNDALKIALDQGLHGATLDTKTLLGEVRGRLVDGKVEYTESEGLIDRIVTKEFPYQPPCVDCAGAGFVYLDSGDLISMKARIWTCVVSFLLSLLVWTVLARRRRPARW